MCQSCRGQLCENFAHVANCTSEEAGRARMEGARSGPECKWAQMPIYNVSVAGLGDEAHAHAVAGATGNEGEREKATRSSFAFRAYIDRASKRKWRRRERERAQEGTAAPRRRRLIHLRHSQSPLRSLSGPLQRLQQFVIDGQRKDERARTCRASSIEPIRKPNCESENGERIRA